MAMHVHQQVARLGGHKSAGSEIYAQYKGPDQHYFRLPKMRTTSPSMKKTTSPKNSPNRNSNFHLSSLPDGMVSQKTLKQYRGTWSSISDSLSSPRTLHNTALFSFQQADVSNKGFVELAATRALIDRLCVNSDVEPLTDDEFAKYWFAVSKKKRGYVGFDEYMAFLQRVVGTKAQTEKERRRREEMEESKREETARKERVYDDIYNPYKAQDVPDQSPESLLHEILQSHIVNKILSDNNMTDNPDTLLNEILKAQDESSIKPNITRTPVKGTDFDRIEGDVYWVSRTTGEKTWTAPVQPKAEEVNDPVVEGETKLRKSGSSPPKEKQPTSTPITGTPWEKITTPEGEVYYYNRDTGDTSWDAPLAL